MILIVPQRRGPTSGQVRRKPRKGSLGEALTRAGFDLEETEYPVLPARGRFHDLFARLLEVRDAFLPALPASKLPAVGWCDLDRENAWALFALLDDVILVDKALDRQSTPPYVIEYLLLHELLHLLHAPDEGGEQEDWHGAAFDEEERAFPRAQEAEAWLDRRAAGQLAGDRPSSFRAAGRS